MFKNHGPLILLKTEFDGYKNQKLSEIHSSKKIRQNEAVSALLR